MFNIKTLVLLLVVTTATVSVIETQDITDEKILSAGKLDAAGISSININQNDAAHNKSDSIELWEYRRNGRFSYLYAVEEDLLHQNWGDREKPCLHQLLNIVRNVQNLTLWATWIWDSMQFPVGQLYGSRNHLGNYDQCMNLPWKEHPEWRTQFCLAEIKLSELDPGVTGMDLYGSVKKHVKSTTKQGLTYNNVDWGICAPAICKPRSVAKFAEAIFKSSHLGPINTRYNVTVSPKHCQASGEVPQKGLAEYVFMSIVIFLITTTLLCTWYVDSNGAESKSISDFAKAFYIKSNAQQLMKVESNSIRSVLGIRVITAYFVAAGHFWLSKQVFGIGNAGEMDKLWNESNVSMFNADITVDVFFTMSGLLLAKCVMEKKFKSFNPLLVIARRYIRLICSLPLILLMIPTVYRSGGQGPLFNKYLNVELQAWEKSWWKDVLMISNYGETEYIGYPVLWSLACDFHLFVVGILIYWVYHKSPKTGIKVYALCAAAALVIPIVYGYTHLSGAVTNFNFAFTKNYRKYLLGDPAYARTHLRAGPYFVGLAIGYLMALYPRENYRNVMSKKTSVLAFSIFVTLFASLYHISGLYHRRQYGPLEGAIFSVMRRNGFAALICFLIVICEYGSLPLVSDVLSWSVFVPLSKLSYGVYLTHLMITLRFAATTRVPLWSDPGEELYSTFSMMVLTFALSLLMWLFWEAPLTNLFDIFFKRMAVQSQRYENGKITERYNGRLDMEQNGKHVVSEDEKKLN